MKKKICIVTGSRSEYGLLKPLMDEVKKDKHLVLQIIVTGMHLSPAFGSTYKEIEKDGFEIDEKVDISLKNDTPEGVARSTARAMSGMAEAYKRLAPDIVVLLGDRFEIFGAATAAHISRKVIAHIHGGELTEGAIDDAFRHSITKMSHLHFVSTEEYRKRVIQLGEQPEHVYNVGALGVDNIKNMKLLAKKEIEKELGFSFGKRNLLITFHPVTLEADTAEEQFKNLLGVVNNIEDVRLIFTKANADPGGRAINNKIDEYVRRNKEKAVVFTSLGRLRYLSILQYVDAVVGNSSSGIIETPSFHVPTVNLGNRQKGRIKADSVIDCNADELSVLKAIKKALSDDFRNRCKETSNPFGEGNAARKIVKILKKTNIRNSKKKFFNME